MTVHPGRGRTDKSGTLEPSGTRGRSDTSDRPELAGRGEERAMGSWEILGPEDSRVMEDLMALHFHPRSLPDMLVLEERSLEVRRAEERSSAVGVHKPGEKSHPGFRLLGTVEVDRLLLLLDTALCTSGHKLGVLG